VRSAASPYVDLRHEFLLITYSSPVLWLLPVISSGVALVRRDARRGTLAGLAATGGVITPAGLVLVGTFAVLATIPSTTLTEIGFAVAFGILLDTIIARSVLVTALNLDIGRWMWWPSSLARKPDPAPEELSQERAISDSHSQVAAFERLP